jgi:hypothetical protein
MKIDTTISDVIKGRIREEYEKKEKEHQSSGKLSASVLGWPTQWQVLKYLQAPTSAYDDYTLSKFKRGDHVESFVKQYLPNHGSQIKVEYKNCIGYLDILYALVPHEIKSVTNMKFKYIQKNGQADPQHRLQAAFYALGLGLNEVSESRWEIDSIIAEYDRLIEEKSVPVFTPRYKWQENQLYNPYPEFVNLSEIQIIDKLNSLGINWK